MGIVFIDPPVAILDFSEMSLGSFCRGGAVYLQGNIVVVLASQWSTLAYSNTTE